MTAVAERQLDWMPADADGWRLQRIEVMFTNGNPRPYAYAWGGEGDINLGDLVHVPRPPKWKGAHWGLAQVTRIGTGYEGPVATIAKRFKEIQEETLMTKILDATSRGNRKWGG